MNALRFALAIAELGYPVLPIKPRSKVPACRGGLRGASLDPEALGRLFDRPSLNLAVLPPAGVLVLDADTRDAAASLLRYHRELRRAPRASTPRGGTHFYLSVAPDGPTRARVGALPDVDVRGLGRAYVLAPPSVTDAGSYRWSRSLVPPSALPAACPELLRVLSGTMSVRSARRLITGGGSTRYGWTALHCETRQVASAPEGRRNDTLNRASFAAGRLIAAGHLPRHQAELALYGAATRCGLPITEAIATVRSGIDAGMGSPRGRASRASGPPRGARAESGLDRPVSVGSPAPAQPAHGGLATEGGGPNGT